MVLPLMMPEQRSVFALAPPIHPVTCEAHPSDWSVYEGGGVMLVTWSTVAPFRSQTGLADDRHPQVGQTSEEKCSG